MGDELDDGFFAGMRGAGVQRSRSDAETGMAAMSELNETDRELYVGAGGREHD